MTSLNRTQVAEMSAIMEDEFSVVVENYIEDTQAVFAELNVLQAAGEVKAIKDHLHRLKSASFQVGAQGVYEKILMMETLLKNIDEVSHVNLGAISRLNHHFSGLREAFYAYRTDIAEYL